MSTPRTWTFADDPLTDVVPSLLNSVDIQRYQNACRIISDAHFDPDRLKSASYEIPFRGDVYWRDLKRTIHFERIDGKGKPFQLRPNSIVYISPDAYFNIPDFIALRFNLSITYVHW